MPDEPQPPPPAAAPQTGKALRAALERHLGDGPPDGGPGAPPPVPDHTLLRRIGRGAYGEVWLARNALGTLRAVKVVFRARFQEDRPYEREFHGILKYEPISRTHEGLVQVLHVGRGEGCFYYVMELADEAGGEREKGRKSAGENPPLSPPHPFSPAPNHGHAKPGYFVLMVARSLG